MRSVCSASSCRSNINCMCSSKESGTPEGGLRHLPFLPARIARLDELDPPFDLADVLDVLVQRDPVRRAQSSFEPSDLGRDPVDHAAVRAAPRRSVLGRVPGAEQPLEHDARLADRRKRLVGRGPRERGRVRAVVVVRAAAAAIDALDAEFERREHRLPPEALRMQLVERSAEEDVGPLRLLRMGLGQEHRRRSVVVAADLLRPKRFRRSAVPCCSRSSGTCGTSPAV